MDWGYSNDPTSLIAMYKYNDAYIFDELIYQKGLLNSDISDLLKTNNVNDIVYADSAEPKSIAELKTAFQIGFIIFIPFLVIDMVVASVLMSMGMMMMSPVMVSLPFKLMLFVLVDGWHLLLGSLVQSFGT